MPGSTMFPACRYSRPCAINRPDSQTFSPDGPDTRHSKANGHTQAATLTDAAFKYRDSRLYMVKSKVPLDVRWSRPLPSVPSTVTVSRDAAGRYFVSCLCGVKRFVRHRYRIQVRQSPPYREIRGSPGATPAPVKQKGQRLKEPRQSPLKGGSTRKLPIAARMPCTRPPAN